MSPHMPSHGCILQPVSHTAAGARCLWVFQERVDVLAAFNTLKPGSRSKGVGRGFFSGGGMRWGRTVCLLLCSMSGMLRGGRRVAMERAKRGTKGLY